ADLARVLEETEEWVIPLRKVLLTSIQSEDLRWERWEKITAVEGDIRDACRILRERLGSLASRHGKGDWTVKDASGAFTAAEASGSAPRGHDPITDFLRSITVNHREIAPWVPFWRLEGCGGALNWTCPLNNRSKQQDAVPAGGQRDDQLHSWLYP